MNVVLLRSWWEQPIHCPFCGGAIPPDESIGCEHQLYQFSGGVFLYSSGRFNQAMGIGSDPDCPDDPVEEKDLPAGTTAVSLIAAARQKFANIVEFDVPSPTDGSIVAFAPFESELCGWNDA